MGLFNRKSGKKQKDPYQQCIDSIFSSVSGISVETAKRCKTVLENHVCKSDSERAYHYVAMAYISYKLGDRERMKKYVREALPYLWDAEDSPIWVFTNPDVDANTGIEVIKDYTLNKKDAFALSVLVDMMLKNGYATEAANILDNALQNWDIDKYSRKRLEKLRKKIK